MQIYKFFNSTAGDPRTYRATDFVDYFGSVLSTGLLHTDNVPGMRATVLPGTLRTSITAGKAIMEGHLYENTATVEITHDLPETSADRIDRVVLRLNLENEERNILLKVVKGTPSGNPIAPSLRRDNFVYEISLARVRVRANTVQLLPGDLVDERLNAELCGIVYSLISIPVDQFQQQWDDLMESVQSEGFTPSLTFTNHTKDQTAHGIGDRANLATTNKTTLVAAINEAFQSASNGKTAIKNAVTGVDPKIVIPANPTFPQLATAISQINTGKKFASGKIPASAIMSMPFQNQAGGDSTAYYGLSATGLSFTPKTVYLLLPGGTVGTTVSIEDNMPKYLGFNIITLSGAGTAVRLTGNAKLIYGGFTLPVSYSASGEYSWVAFE